MRRSFLLAGWLTLAASAPLAAQTGSSTAGFNLGAGLNGTAIELDDDDLGNGDGSSDSGPGIALNLGYNFNPRIGVFLNASGALVSGEDENEYNLGVADLGARYTFANSSSFAPYLELAFTGLAASDEVEGADVEMNGNGWSGAAGLHYFFSPTLAADAQLRYATGEFTELTVDGEGITDEDGIGVNVGRFNLGLAWYP